MIISALEIGFVLSAVLLMMGYVSNLPKPKRVRVRARHTGPGRRPHA